MNSDRGVEPGGGAPGAAGPFVAAAAESLGAAIIGVDSGGVIVVWNGGAERLYGRRAAEAVGRPLASLALPEEFGLTPANLGEVGLGGGAKVYEAEVTLEGGRGANFSVTLSPVEDERGLTVGVTAVARDVTERKRSDEEVGHLGQRNRTILESITDAFFAVDAGWRFTYVNAQAERVLGREPGDLIGRSLWDEYPGLAGTDFEKAYRRAAAERVPSTLTAHYPDHDRWYEVHAYPASGGITVYFRDVTERVRAEESLRRLQSETERSRRLYDTILSNTPDLVYVFDLDHRFTYANDVLLRMWGKTWEEAAGKTCLELGYEPWHAAMHDREIEQVVATRQPIRGEVPFTGTFGRRFYDYIFVPIIGADGRVEAVAGTTRDVTERKREEMDRQFLLELGEKIRFGETGAGELLEEVTRNTSGHLGTARCLFIEIDEAANRGAVRYEFCRKGVPPVPREYRITDYSPATLAEIKGGHVIVNHDAETDARTAGIFGTVYEPYGERSYVSVPLFTDGRWAAIFWVSDDRPRRWTPREVSLLESVGERAWLAAEKLRKEADLRESEARLRLAVDISRMSTFEIDLLTDAVRTDETGREIYGFGKDEPLTFARVQSQFHPDDREEVMRRVGAALDPAGAEEFEVEQRIVRADGGTRWIRVRGRAFFEGAGETRKAVRCLGTYIDITGDKLVEQERERLLLLERAARREAEDASRLKDEFLATVSHELRTPLTAILGWSHMLTTGMASQEHASHALETIYRNAQAQAQLIEDILDVSRIVTGKLRISAKPILASPVIQTAVESLRPSVEAKGISLETRFDFEPRMIHADPDRLQQVIWNLLSNAVKFTPEGGRVAVGLESGETETRIVVSDTGKGIAPEFLPYVFDRFRQADGSTTRAHGGLGLGLSIVRHIVELHGGEVEVMSHGEGRGTTFTVRLPLSDASSHGAEDAGGLDSRAGRRRQGPAGESAPGGAVGGTRVLLLDDEEETLELIAAVLARNGVEVRPQTSVRGALEVIREWKPDVIVSDIAMPGEDGYAFIRKLRALPPEEGGAIPAVALTAYVGIKERTRVLSSGFQMYVPKPVEPSELLSALASLSPETARRP